MAYRLAGFRFENLAWKADDTKMMIWLMKNKQQQRLKKKFIRVLFLYIYIPRYIIHIRQTLFCIYNIILVQSFHFSIEMCDNYGGVENVFSK